MPTDIVYLICIYPIAIHVSAENYILLNYITIIPQITLHFNELALMICGVFYYDFGFFRAISRKREREALPAGQKSIIKRNS